MPIVALHDAVAALALPLVVLVLLVLLLLLLLQPATASAPTAAAARTRRPFIGYASISGMSHNVGFPIERTAFRLMACRQIGRLLIKHRRGLAATAVVRTGMRDGKLNTPSPMGRFRTADQTIAVYAKTRGLVWVSASSCEFDIDRAAFAGPSARGGSFCG